MVTHQDHKDTNRSWSHLLEVIDRFTIPWLELNVAYLAEVKGTRAAQLAGKTTALRQGSSVVLRTIELDCAMEHGAVMFAHPH